MLGLALLGSLGVAGCALQATPEEVVYRLEATPSRPATPPHGQVEVLTPRVAGSLAGSLGLRVVYLGEVIRVDEASGGRWEDPPAETMERVLRTAFLPRPEADTEGPRWRLQWSLDQVEAVVPAGAADPVEARVLLTWTLRRDRDREDHAAGVVLEQAPVPAGAAPADLVLAFNQAVTRALERLVMAVAQATRTP
ncbi:ABC-type transport auxiliary lipoprotein family protein [Roseospira visakhapatnamensis]|uniref:ABC-type transport auxiliary lipoprotein component domain-containing protein n=1 Tax=Roseospira visakhapatnamensis TaxID=390880 RepID=A0A7W6RC24_9PROT|nr:ABC-type transport auxiliary lipoprotein family protein [Roseospira visakhapatnamensis]MBB4265214.1 hypothetical protein [Roseospira visakhapatnamensis]